MNGIEKITEKIIADAKHSAAEVVEAARKDAQVVGNQFAEREAKEKSSSLESAKRRSAERELRMISVAELEGRKQVLALKQNMIDETFTMALEKLRNLPTDEYVSLLANLAAHSSQSGKEEIILSPKDHEQFGAAIVSKANTLKPGAQLTLSVETRTIFGGLLLKQGDVEINCTLDTQVRLLREEMALAIAHVLFE